MIRRLRGAAPRMLVLGLSMLVVMTAAAQAVKVEYVTTGELHRFVVVTFLSGAGVILSGLAIIYSMVTTSRDREMRAAISANTQAVAALTSLMQDHHLDPYAHPIGSANRIDPINGKLDKLSALLAQVYERAAVLVAGQTTTMDELTEQDIRIASIEKALTTLVAEHNIMHGSEVTMKRFDDPPTLDPTPMRKQKP